MPQLVISVFGLIGSGKTTCINTLCSELYKKGINVMNLSEPVNLWTSPNNYLKEIEMNSELRAISQTYILSTLEKQYINTRGQYDRVVIMERSVDNAIDEFCADINSEPIQHIFRHFAEEERQRPIDVFVYMETSIDTCIDRIKKRNRDGEFTAINEDKIRSYLNVLNEREKNYCKKINDNNCLMIRITPELYNIRINSLVNSISSIFMKDRTIDIN